MWARLLDWPHLPLPVQDDLSCTYLELLSNYVVWSGRLPPTPLVTSSGREYIPSLSPQARLQPQTLEEFVGTFQAALLAGKEASRHITFEGPGTAARPARTGPQTLFRSCSGVGPTFVGHVPDKERVPLARSLQAWRFFLERFVCLTQGRCRLDPSSRPAFAGLLSLLQNGKGLTLRAGSMAAGSIGLYTSRVLGWTSGFKLLGSTFNYKSTILF